MKKNKKKIFLIAGGIFLMIAAGVLFTVMSGLPEGRQIPINGINLSDVPDGGYTGVYEFERWSNTVIVHVKDHAISAIDIEKDMAGAGITNAADEIFRRVIEAQDTTVDMVSGATVTSKAYLKAIENALEK